MPMFLNPRLTPSDTTDDSNSMIGNSIITVVNCPTIRDFIKRTPEFVYIKYIPKDQLLYELWNAARWTKCFAVDPTIAKPRLTLKKVRRDINYMIVANRNIDLTTYYGKKICMNLTNNTCNVAYYNLHNGYGAATKVIDKLKIDQLQKTITRFFTYY